MSTKQCEKSPDGLHHYKSAESMHAIDYHTCHECVFCGNAKCVNVVPPELRSDIEKLKLPTGDELDV